MMVFHNSDKQVRDFDLAPNRRDGIPQITITINILPSNFSMPFPYAGSPKDLSLFLVCILHKTGVQIPDNRARPNGLIGVSRNNVHYLWEETDHCRILDIPSAEYCHFKYLLNITRPEQAEVHKAKKLNFVHFISSEMQMDIPKKKKKNKKVSHLIAACL